MGLTSRIAGFFRRKSSSPEGWWSDFGQTGKSVTGININQYTSLNSTAVMAAATMLCEDVAKLPWTIMQNAEGDSQREAKGHYLYDLMQEPNDWMDGFELREMMQMGLVLRGNAYAIIKRDFRGKPIALIPWNPDRVLQWVSVNGDIFYHFTMFNIHEQAIIRGLSSQIVGATLLPAEDVLHIRGFSLDGLIGMSRISLAREAIALGLSQEQQAARWMGQGAKPSGMLTTDQKLTPEAAKRLASDFRENVAGLQNSGKIIVGEQGLKFQPFTMTSADLEFIASRQFQLQEVARIFRIPPHMMGELSRCMPASTIVYTLNGPKRIVDVEQGEFVWSCDGDGIRPSRVIGCYDNGEDEILEIATTNRTFKCNATHRILARRAHELPLARGQTGGRNVNGRKVRVEWKTEYVAAGDLRKGDAVVALKSVQDLGGDTAPNGRQLTVGFMEFCGLLLGDGNVTRDGEKYVGVQIARSENALYMDHYRKVMREEFTAGGTIPAHGQRHGMAKLTAQQVEEIRASASGYGANIALGERYGVSAAAVKSVRAGASWSKPKIADVRPVLLVEGERQTAFKSITAAAELCDLGFLGTAFTKSVPGWVYGLREDLRLALLRGFLDADGTVNKMGRIAFDSASRTLLEGVRHLCFGLGVPVTNIQVIDQTTLPPFAKAPVRTRMFRFTCSDPAANARIGSHDPRYVERMAAGKPFSRKGRAYPRQGGEGFALEGAELSAVVSITRLPKERVFDLEIDGTHCFIADGVVVHNSTNNNIAQMAQEYINFTLTGYTNRWRSKMSQCFSLRGDNLSIEFDYRALTTADMTSRINNWRIAIMSMMATPNEARIDLGWKPMTQDGADDLHFPANMASAGSQSVPGAPDGAGRPEGSTSDGPKENPQ